MAEKCTKQLPPIRVPDTLEQALKQLAISDDRGLSEYIRLVLTRHVLGYGATLPHDEGREK